MTRTIILGVTLAFWALALHAGEPNFERELAFVEETVTIDGRLNEALWKKATRIDDFYTFVPQSGLPAEERTAALLAYNKEYLYVAFIAFYDDPSKIRATLARRDNIDDDDVVTLFIDPFNEAHTAYQFSFNPYGIQSDGLFTEYVGEDLKPDYLMYSAGRRFAKGYVVEVAIPFSSLTFPDKDVMKWRFGLFRRTQYKNHDILWPKLDRYSTAFLGQLGTLTNIRGISARRPLHILPEVTASRAGALSANRFKYDPFKGDAGLSLRYGLGTDIIMDATINPDFSQVEADANRIDVNIRSPLYYSEKRTFFLEGKDIFETPLQAVYTRRIVDPLAGLKLSGHLGDYNFSVLSAADAYQGQDDYLSGYGLNAGMTGYDDYAGKNSYNTLFRVRTNILENSNAGFILTDREFAGSFNRVGGFDTRLAFNRNNMLALQGLYTWSKEPNRDKAITDPALYANYYYSSEWLSLFAKYEDLGKNVRFENGFIPRQDLLNNGYRNLNAQLWHEFRSNESWLQIVRPMVYGDVYYDHDRQLLEETFYGSLDVTLSSRTDISLALLRARERFDGDLFTKNNYLLSISNKFYKWLFASVYLLTGDEIFYTSPAFLGKSAFISTRLTLKPTPSLAVYLSQRFYRFNGGNGGLDYSLTQNIPRLKIKWQISRSISFRFITEHEALTFKDDFLSFLNDNQYYFSFLFSYEPSPGTVFYLGYDDFQNQQPGFSNGLWPITDYRRTRNVFFTKLSYLFRW
ncbi:MAG: hypothetical protein D6677_00860 [Calditrichaeota bacterium]|nr:MAG: hypothetical protein D6677_00860 [Calditrichota bacterium]